MQILEFQKSNDVNIKYCFLCSSTMENIKSKITNISLSDQYIFMFVNLSKNGWSIVFQIAISFQILVIWMIQLNNKYTKKKFSLLGVHDVY